MGWTGVVDDRPAHVVVTEELEDGGRHRVVARSGRYYAVEDLSTGEVSAVVVLTRRRDGMLYWKLVDESMGPADDRCPPAVLRRLSSPAPNEHAEAWRARCWANVGRRAVHPQLRPGDRIRLGVPVEFTDGTVEDTFTYEGKFRFVTPDGLLVRLNRDWKTRYDWEVVS